MISFRGHVARAINLLFVFFPCVYHVGLYVDYSVTLIKNLFEIGCSCMSSLPVMCKFYHSYQSCLGITLYC